MKDDHDKNYQSQPNTNDKKPSRRELVENAVLQLMLDGKAPTITAVRAITKTGSYSTITSDIKEILRSLAVLTSPNTGIPHEVTKAFNTIWFQSLATAKEQHSDELLKALLENESLTAANGSLLTDLHLAEQSLNSSLEQMAQRNELIDQLNSRINHMKTTIAEMESTAISEHRKVSSLIEEKTYQLNHVTTKIQQLEIAHEKALSDLQAEHKERISSEISRSEAAENKWIQQTSNLQVLLNKKNEEMHESQMLISALKSQISTLSRENAQLNLQASSLENALRDSESKLQSNESLQKSMQAQYDLMRSIHNKMETLNPMPQNNTGGGNI